MPDLSDLFTAHQGKASEKLSSDISFCDEIFQKLRDRPIRLLKIGLQNGGSLEIGAEYLPNAVCLVGCDVNEMCRELVFDDR